MIGAVVIAAGAGRRLGTRCKATLPIENQTFLERIVSVGKSAGIGEWCVVTGKPHHDETSREATRLGLKTVYNPRALEMGMSSSIALGFASMVATDADAAFLWPVDIPMVSEHTLKTLIEQHIAGGITAPHDQGRAGHPPLISSEVFQALSECSDIQGGARALLRKVSPYKAIDVQDSGIMHDVDRVDDLP